MDLLMLQIQIKTSKRSVGTPVSDEKCLFLGRIKALSQAVDISRTGALSYFCQYVSRNNVVDVKRISNNFEIKSAKT